MGMLKRLLEDQQETFEDFEDARMNYSRKRDKHMGDFDVEERDEDTTEQ